MQVVDDTFLKHAAKTSIFDGDPEFRRTSLFQICEPK